MSSPPPAKAVITNSLVEFFGTNFAERLELALVSFVANSTMP